jgi:tRNA modification GTPase
MLIKPKRAVNHLKNKAVNTANDTIAAIATPPGFGGIGVIRVSGPASKDVAQSILGLCPPPRLAKFLPFKSNAHVLIDEGIALFFEGPNSFTGEDVLELQAHGGPAVLDLLMSAVLENNIRPARPGEFSERAFLNNKLDLTQAEAVADLISSTHHASAQAAMRSLQGAFSKKIHELLNELIELRKYVEAAIDFAEEEIDFLSDGKVAAQTENLITHIDGILKQAQMGALMRDGMTVVIAGRPNAGKSTLLNALSGRDSAIVTDIPGTTRDIMRENIHIDGLPLHIIDTAGIRPSEDVVELEGIKRAQAAMEQADRILLIIDANDLPQLDVIAQECLQAIKAEIPVTIIINKIDAMGVGSQQIKQNNQDQIFLSAKTQDGLSLLIEHLKQVMSYEQPQEGAFMARRRHVDALLRAQDFIKTGLHQLTGLGAGELFAEDCRQAQLALSEITGEFTSDDLLGEIFSSFCVGK